MDSRPRSPPEPEETYRYAESGNERRWQSLLWLQFAILIELRLCVFMQIPEKWGNRSKSAYEDADER